MQINTKAKNLELTEYWEKVVDEKVGKLEKFAKTLAKDSFEVFVELSKETNHHKKGDLFVAQASIHLPGKSLVAKARGEDLLKAIGDMKDEMEIEIKKHKTKMIEEPRREAKKAHQEGGF